MRNDSWIVVTGATGFLGGRVIQELMESTTAGVIALGRSGSYSDLTTRLKSLWWGRDALVSHLGGRIVALEADISKEGLGLYGEDKDFILSRGTHVVHTAAEVRPTVGATTLGAVNVRGTANVLSLAKEMDQGGSLRQFLHVSTAYVAGTRSGSIPESLLEGDSGYSSLYEQSKAQAEGLVAESGLPFAIVRPGQIVGDSQTGFVSSFNTMYYVLKLYMRGQLSVAPVSSKLRMNIIPVDYVAKMVVGSLDRPAGFVANAVMPFDALPTAGQLVNLVRQWCAQEGVAQLPPVAFASVPALSKAGRSQNLKGGKKGGIARNLLTLSPYFAEDKAFDCENAWEAAGVQPPRWQDFVPVLLSYAVRMGFMDHTDRTVFQQMGVRQNARSTKITYHDVTAQGIADYQPGQVEALTQDMARSLKAMGLRKGDRVAMVGVNSVRYLALDAACGMLGLVTVPIYYTTPAAEVCQLVKRSASLAVFVGVESLLERLEEDQVGVPVISIIDGQQGASSCSWEDFLACGTGQSLDGLEAPSPDDLATVRYTSGTTGNPKGTLFTQGQLRWMGQTMASVMDWKTRTSPVRYLSFLPMSHVVEGILVAYAPYYLLTDVDLYYLKDFGALEKSLPKVRPTIFFSVPRFYEKLWATFVSTGPGKAFDAMPDGPAKRALAVPMRKVLLKKAGLDACRQLIVGSAPLGDKLQGKFQSLGIEIYDAFGVTEAPLITLSRLGKNEPGSVGDLLPETQARLTDEGIVQVRGPQVTLGYDGMAEGALTADGWFDTGDYGEFSPSGRLILRGRKKDLLVTSYGKNIAPQKVEGVLKAIDGVSEAVLVGDGKPFVSALLWVDEGCDFHAIDQAIREANKGLSHPEQVKRWLVAQAPLSISSGELTPNLKVKRNKVVQQRVGLVEALYGNWDSLAEGALHKGND